MISPASHGPFPGKRIENMHRAYRNERSADVLRQFYFGAKEPNDNLLWEITSHCKETISHIGFEVNSIKGTLDELSESGFYFIMQRPIVASQGIPKRFNGSQGKIALISDIDDALRFELFEVAWKEPFSRMGQRERSRLIDHIAVEVSSKDSLRCVAAVVEKCFANVFIELPITENLTEHSAFFYTRNRMGDRLEFISYG